MLLEIKNIFSISIIEVVDILIVAIIIYQMYRLLKGTTAIKMLFGIVSIFFIWKIVDLFHMTMLSKVLDQFINVGVIALIIVFQPEIRKFLFMLGTPNYIQKKGINFFKFIKQEENKLDVDCLIKACIKMSKFYTGALIVLTRENSLDEYAVTGEEIDAKMSEELIENIFFKNSPLHDGALIILHHRIEAARCILPVAKDIEISSDLGLRHRSAIGSTSMTDALAIVVSEQTGQISLCQNGQIVRDISPTVLKQLLTEAMTNIKTI